MEWGYLAIANNMLGIMSLNRGNAPFAIDYYIKAVTICQQYHLPHIEWMIHMNIGSLYLNIEEYQKALDHIEISYRYIMDHPDMDEYLAYLTVAYLGMAKAYLRLDDEYKALEFDRRINQECMPTLDERDKLIVYCYEARLFHHLHDETARDRYIELVNANSSKDMPIMDVFDDYYDYLEMLLNIERYDDFFKIYTLMDELTKKTTVKNMEKKLLALKIRYFRRTGQIDEYKLSAVLFYEISEYMEKENKLMVNNMIVMRNSFNELSEINKKVEEENKNLHHMSETDALSGLNNRFKFNVYSEKAFDRALKNHTPMAIEILDIDYFKQYNDNYGHQAGDECIKGVADMIKKMQDEYGVFCARYGGDEFVIIYEGFSKDETLARAEQLRRDILAKAFEHKFSLAANVVTISQGICWDIPKEGQSAADFLHKADDMLYRVKKVTRNNVKLGTFEDKED